MDMVPATADARFLMGGQVVLLDEFDKRVNPKDVAQKMKLEYSRGVKDHTAKSLDALCGLLWKFEKTDVGFRTFAQDAAEVISRLFAIESVAVGTRDPADRLYKYVFVTGLDGEVTEAYKSLKYSREQLLDPVTYPCYDISEHTKLFLAEDHPYAQGEELTYRRPGMIGLRRRDLTDSLEADYLDIFFRGHGEEILGFIETSGTRLKKLPDAATIRWIELVAGILGVAAQRSR
jgi:hypothetical protein